jgi:putative two-component system response regulator
MNDRGEHIFPYFDSFANIQIIRNMVKFSRLFVFYSVKYGLKALGQPQIRKVGVKKTIFIVDDVDTNLTMAVEALKNQYRVFTMLSAAKMFTLLEKITPDMILLDIEMPDMDGFEALKQLKSNESCAGIPVIFLTGMADEEAEVRGFELGVIDFITKPFSSPILLNRLKSHLNINELIRERTVQLENIKNCTITVLADMVEARDKNTDGHIERTSFYIKMLMNSMMDNSTYIDEIEGWDIDTVVSAARLHDLGKISISDIILNKPGMLTDEEYTMIQAHAIEGEQIIDKIITQTGDETFLHHAKLFAGYHHERWDGTGYSRGLKGMEIPLQGRIMAVVDVYDALISERSYKKAFTAAEAMEIIVYGAGKHFDPLIVEAFEKVKNLIGGIK